MGRVTWSLEISPCSAGALALLTPFHALWRSHSSTDLAERRRYISLVELAQANGARTLIFSTLHPSGEQLGHMTGIAAILRYPLSDLEAEVAEEEAKRAQNATLGALAPRPDDAGVAEAPEDEVFF